MIRNEYAVLKNGDTIFKSQVVETYLRLNTTSTANQFICATGITANNPLDIYYNTPTGVIKCCNTSNLFGQTLTFPATGEGSYKDFYYCGGLECVTSFRTTHSFNNGCYTGDLICHMNQFPNLEYYDLSARETDFNQDISNSSFPENLQAFSLCDRGITGDLTTVKNFDSITCLNLYYTQFTGNISGIGNDFQCFNTWNTPLGFQYCVNDLVNNSTCLSRFTSWSSAGISLCADTLDMSDFEYFCMYGAYSSVKGNMSGWTFNTGLTCLYNISCCLEGDISNWDFSNTELRGLQLQNYNYNFASVSGDLSGWTFPDGIQNIYFYGLNDVTCIVENYSNSDLFSFYLYQMNNLNNDLGDFDFGSTASLNTLSFQYTSMTGDLDGFNFPSGVTNYYFSYNNFTGNISGITLCDNVRILDLAGNDLNGDITNFNVPSDLCRFGVSHNTGITLNLSSASFDTCNIRDFCIENISGITGSFSNFTTGNALRTFRARNTFTSASLNDFDFNNLCCFIMSSAGLSQDITTFLSKATGLTYLCIDSNPNLSGDTTGIDFSELQTFNAYDTALSGSMCHFNPYCMRIANTSISSNIETDFDFSSRAYYIIMNTSNLSGHLSGVSHNFSCVYYFQVYDNSNICGSNEYTDYIFANRKNFTRPQVFLSYYGIGDTVSGTSEQLGDLGTYGGDPSGMDLTEEQVNNLVAGTDYDGLGTNTPWSGKNKIWWMKNACVSSSSTSKRYTNFYITYSG